MIKILRNEAAVIVGEHLLLLLERGGGHSFIYNIYITFTVIILQGILSAEI